MVREGSCGRRLAGRAVRGDELAMGALGVGPATVDLEVGIGVLAGQDGRLCHGRMAARGPLGAAVILDTGEMGLSIGGS